MNEHAIDAANSRGQVLVTGAAGFLGGFIVAALRRGGYRVRRGVRRVDAGIGSDDRVCDIARMHSLEDWCALLQGVHVVVNVAGILREQGTQKFAAIHHDGPLALAQACVQCGVGKFVQISALGHPDDGEFIASKHRFDAALLALPMDAVVLRPSVVYSAAGSYGGSSLLRALAAVPWMFPLPGDGRWPFQPLAAEDLGELVVAVLATPTRGMFEVGGPQPISLRDYLRLWRHWLRLPDVFEPQVPVALIDAGVAVAEFVGRGPMGATTWRMLKRGNITAPDASARLQACFGYAPRAIEDVLQQRPSQVQDRWQAQLYFLAPVLRAAVIVLFAISAWAGWFTPAADIRHMVEGSLLARIDPVLLARAAAGVDALLALALLAGWQTRRVLAFMCVLVLAYTLAFGTLLPGAWLDPLGGLAKNLVVLPALAVLWIISERR